MNNVLTRLAQIEVVPGAPAVNTERMLSIIADAKADNVDLVIFPELSIPGCLIGDAWERCSFLRECEDCGRRVIAASSNIVVAFGNVAIDWDLQQEDGRPRKYNAFFVAEDGELVKRAGCVRPFTIKTLHPNYREFDDSRYFYDSRKLAASLGCKLEDILTPYQTKRAGCIGGLLCEDAWENDYGISPATILANKGAEFLVVASASPFSRNKRSKRVRVCSSIAVKTKLPVVYVNAVGVQDIGKTVYAYDGGSGIYDATGARIDALKPFQDATFSFRIPLSNVQFGTVRDEPNDGIGDIADALRYGVCKFMKRLNVKRTVIGVSGGIDSAVSAALYGSFLAPSDLLLVGMPGPYTSATTRGLGRQLSKNLGAKFVEIPISTAVELTRREFSDLVCEGRRGDLELSSFAVENVQARDRGSRVLAAAAAAFGGVVSCNANKAEITIGYGTLYGDILGWLACLGDLWKGEVYALGRYLNSEIYGRDVIPEGIFNIKPSAELSEKQAVEKGLGDPLNYPYHDALFRSWVERWERATPEDALEWYAAGNLAEQLGYDGDIGKLFATPADFISDLERWWNLHQGLAVAKRMQAPPVLAVSRRAYGFDLREAQIGPHYSARYAALKAKILSK